MNDFEKQKALENEYQANQLHFFRTVTGYMNEIKDKDVRLDLASSINTNDEDYESNRSSFQYLGCISYLVGLDFCSQTYINRNVVKNASERLEKFVLPENYKREFIQSFIKIIKNTDMDVFEKVFQRYSSEVDSDIPSKYISTVSGILYSFKLILANSAISVKYAIEINNILEKNSLTYQDVLKIDNIVSQYCVFMGLPAINKFNQLFMNSNYQNLLKESTDKYEQYKFGTLFIESIQTLKDFLSSEKYDEETIIKMMLGEIEEETFEKEESEFRARLEKDKEIKSDDKKALYEDKIEEIMKTDPIHAIMVISDESLGFKIKNVDDFINGIEKVCESTDYMGSIYHYVKAKIKDVNSECSMGEYDINPSEILTALNTKVEKLREEYKNVAEEICADLGNFKNDVNTLVNNTIGSLVLQSNDQKSYLISQFMKPSLETYQHFTQIMNLIESSDMIADEKGLRAYKNLYNFVQKNMSKKLEIINSSEPLFNRLSMFIAVRDMFKKYTEKEGD